MKIVSTKSRSHVLPIRHERTARINAELNWNAVIAVKKNAASPAEATIVLNWSLLLPLVFAVTKSEFPARILSLVNPSLIYYCHLMLHNNLCNSDSITAGGELTELYKTQHLNHCAEPCTKILACEHQCKGTCGGCFNGRVHRACQEDCGRTLVCGHKYTYIKPVYSFRILQLKILS